MLKPVFHVSNDVKHIFFDILFLVKTWFIPVFVENNGGWVEFPPCRLWQDGEVSQLSLQDVLEGKLKKVRLGEDNHIYILSYWDNHYDYPIEEVMKKGMWDNHYYNHYYNH
jgi:hypothetical protein